MYTHTHKPQNRRGHTQLVNFLYLARCVRACVPARNAHSATLVLASTRCQMFEGIQRNRVSFQRLPVGDKASRFPRLANAVASYNATVHTNLEGP